MLRIKVGTHLTVVVKIRSCVEWVILVCLHGGKVKRINKAVGPFFNNCAGDTALRPIYRLRFLWLQPQEMQIQTDTTADMDTERP